MTGIDWFLASGVAFVAVVAIFVFMQAGPDT